MNDRTLIWTNVGRDWAVSRIRNVRFSRETRSGRPTVRTISARDPKYRVSPSHLRRTSIALQQSAERLIADDFTDLRRDWFVRRRSVERHVPYALVRMVPA